jgi:hypothetical protein
MENKKKRYQMNFDMTENDYFKIRELAARRNIKPSTWVLRAIGKQIIEDTRFDKPSSLHNM